MFIKRLRLWFEFFYVLTGSSKRDILAYSPEILY